MTVLVLALAGVTGLAALGLLTLVGIAVADERRARRAHGLLVGSQLGDRAGQVHRFLGDEAAEVPPALVTFEDVLLGRHARAVNPPT